MQVAKAKAMLTWLDFFVRQQAAQGFETILAGCPIPRLPDGSVNTLAVMAVMAEITTLGLMVDPEGVDEGEDEEGGDVPGGRTASSFAASSPSCVGSRRRVTCPLLSPPTGG